MSYKLYLSGELSKAQLRAYANSKSEIFFLDSCSLTDPRGIGKYDALIGVGTKEVYKCTVDIEVDWDRVNRMANGDSWCFSVMSYDLKNGLNKLSSNNPDSIKAPCLLLVIPEIVVGITSGGSVEIYGDNPDEILQLIRSSKPVKHEAVVFHEEVYASMSKQEYIGKVDQIREEISKGNVYEMNLCIEYVLDDFKANDAFLLYQNLISHSPTPFSCYVHSNEFQILCASPERFIRKRNQFLYSQPIKGTSKRFEDVELDNASRDYLRNSEKERAEHIMIVDLVRNDLSKSGVVGSTVVDELFAVYPFAQVHQMISTIKTQLKREENLSEIIANTFPMGSMTGAPKYIAMQFIEELENAKRGWYSGSVGYIEPGGDFDFNVVIRSLLINNRVNKASFSVGGAITYDSISELEYEECQLKASAVKNLFNL